MLFGTRLHAFFAFLLVASIPGFTCGGGAFMELVSRVTALEEEVAGIERRPIIVNASGAVLAF